MVTGIPLENLGHDVLVDHVFPNLDEKDIANVSKVSKILRDFTKDPAVWHDLYYKTFGTQPNPFTEYKWPEMYRWRRRASLYTWGSRSMGRLGYTMDEIKDEEKATGHEFGVCVPKKVDHLGSTVISDVVAGGYSFTILTGEGHLYGIGDLESSFRRRTRHRVPETVHNGDPGANLVPEGAVAVPLHRNVVAAPFRVGGVRTEHGRWFTPPVFGHTHQNTSEGHQADQSRKSGGGSGAGSDDKDKMVPPLTHFERSRVKKLPTQGGKDVKFVSVTSGRQHVLALDESNNVWIWDWSFAIPAVKLNFALDTNDKPKVQHVIAGWSYSVVLFEQGGIFIWKDIEEKQETVEGDMITLDHNDVTRIPGTHGVKIVDIVAGEHMLIYLTEKSELYYVNVYSSDDDHSSTLTPIRLNTFESKLEETCRFVKLSGSYSKFAVFTDNDKVFMGYRNEIAADPANSEPRIVPELQDVGCISVAVGDHHNLALLRGGKLLTWGRESKACGAFGLGNMDHVINTYNIPANHGGLDLESPTPVKMTGKALAVAAAGWQSAAIITEEQ